MGFFIGLFVVAAFMMSGCSATTGAIDTRIIEVPIETMVPCLADVPGVPDRLDRQGETDSRNLIALAASKLLEWRLYGRQSQSAMARCTEAP